MSDSLTETYPWDEKLFRDLEERERLGSRMIIDAHRIGTIISVKKQHEKDGRPYIEVIFQTYS